eukprot:2175283-Prymnesium_polylepis.1
MSGQCAGLPGLWPVLHVTRMCTEAGHRPGKIRSGKSSPRAVDCSSPISSPSSISRCATSAWRHKSSGRIDISSGCRREQTPAARDLRRHSYHPGGSLWGSIQEQRPARPGCGRRFRHRRGESAHGGRILSGLVSRPCLEHVVRLGGARNRGSA